jgi:hypothetical protein
MLYTIDFLTGNDDDIVINGDIQVESDPYISTMKIAERRISARYDDFALNSIGAGIERFLQKKTQYTTSDIKYAIRSVLEVNSILVDNDYQIYIPEENTNYLQIFLKLNPNLIYSKEDTFKVIVNIMNQRAYRS